MTFDQPGDGEPDDVACIDQLSAGCAYAPFTMTPQIQIIAGDPFDSIRLASIA